MAIFDFSLKDYNQNSYEQDRMNYATNLIEKEIRRQKDIIIERSHKRIKELECECDRLAYELYILSQENSEFKKTIKKLNKFNRFEIMDI